MGKRTPTGTMLACPCLAEGHEYNVERIVGLLGR